MRAGLQTLAMHVTRANTASHVTRARTVSCVPCPYSSYAQYSYTLGCSSSAHDKSRSKDDTTRGKGARRKGAVLVAASMFSVFSSGDAEETKLKKAMGTATMHIHQAEPELAKPYFLQALEMLEKYMERKKGDPVPSMDVVHFMDQLAHIGLRLECYGDAARLYLATINGFALNDVKRSDRRVTETWLTVGQIYAIMGDYRHAELSFLHCLEVTTTELLATEGKQDPLVIELACKSYEGLGKVYLSMNNPKNAISMYTHAIEFAKKVLSENDPHIAVLLSDLATVYESVGRLDEALEATQKAEQFAVLATPMYSQQVSAKKARLCVQLGHLKEAKELYTQLLGLCKERGDLETLREVQYNLKLLAAKEEEVASWEASE